MFSSLKIVAFGLFGWNSHFYWEIIFVLGSQYVNKQSQDISYYEDRIYRTEVLSQWSKDLPKLLPCRIQLLWDSSFFSKCSKFDVAFRNADRKWEGIFSFGDNCIWTGYDKH